MNVQGWRGKRKEYIIFVLSSIDWLRAVSVPDVLNAVREVCLVGEEFFIEVLRGRGGLSKSIKR